MSIVWVILIPVLACSCWEKKRKHPQTSKETTFGVFELLLSTSLLLQGKEIMVDLEKNSEKGSEREKGGKEREWREC